MLLKLISCTKEATIQAIPSDQQGPLGFAQNLLQQLLLQGLLKPNMPLEQQFIKDREEFYFNEALDVFEWCFDNQELDGLVNPAQFLPEIKDQQMQKEYQRLRALNGFNYTLTDTWHFDDEEFKGVSFNLGTRLPEASAQQGAALVTLTIVNIPEVPRDGRLAIRQKYLFRFDKETGQVLRFEGYLEYQDTKQSKLPSRVVATPEQMPLQDALGNLQMVGLLINSLSQAWQHPKQSLPTGYHKFPVFLGDPETGKFLSDATYFYL
jgi:hypothetical protein